LKISGGATSGANDMLTITGTLSDSAGAKFWPAGGYVTIDKTGTRNIYFDASTAGNVKIKATGGDIKVDSGNSATITLAPTAVDDIKGNIQAGSGTSTITLTNDMTLQNSKTLDVSSCTITISGKTLTIDGTTILGAGGKLVCTSTGGAAANVVIKQGRTVYSINNSDPAVLTATTGDITITAPAGVKTATFSATTNHVLALTGSAANSAALNIPASGVLTVADGDSLVLNQASLSSAGFPVFQTSANDISISASGGSAILTGTDKTLTLTGSTGNSGVLSAPSGTLSVTGTSNLVSAVLAIGSTGYLNLSGGTTVGTWNSSMISFAAGAKYQQSDNTARFRDAGANYTAAAQTTITASSAGAGVGNTLRAGYYNLWSGTGGPFSRSAL